MIEPELTLIQTQIKGLPAHAAELRQAAFGKNPEASMPLVCASPHPHSPRP